MPLKRSRFQWLGSIMSSNGHDDIVLEEDDEIYKKGDKFKSFYCQASQPMSRKALLAGFLLVWINKCMVSSPPHDGILLVVLFFAVQLVYGRPFGLLPAMVCCIQNGLRTLTETFCRLTTMKRGKGQVFPLDGPYPRVELLYTYLMMWFVLHCPSIIQPGGEPPEDIHFAHLNHFENSQWERKYVARVQRLVHCYDTCSLFRCFPHIPSAGYNEEFRDEEDGHSSLRQGIFK